MAGEAERELGQGTVSSQGSKSEQDEEPVEARAEKWHDVTHLM